MRRYLWIVLFFIVLLTPFVLRAFVGGGGQDAREATPHGDEKAVRLVVLSAMSEPIRTEFSEAFSRWRPGSTDFGMALIPCWTCQRRMICAGVRPYFAASSATSGASGTPSGRPSGLHACVAIPWSARYARIAGRGSAGESWI